MLLDLTASQFILPFFSHTSSPNRILFLVGLEEMELQVYVPWVFVYFVLGTLVPMRQCLYGQKRAIAVVVPEKTLSAFLILVVWISKFQSLLFVSQWITFILFPIYSSTSRKFPLLQKNIMREAYMKFWWWLQWVNNRVLAITLNLSYYQSLKLIASCHSLFHQSFS